MSCKTLTSGNRTVETYTYKTERDGIIETHVEHRVTIHSDEPIDHDAVSSSELVFSLVSKIHEPGFLVGTESSNHGGDSNESGYDCGEDRSASRVYGLNDARFGLSQRTPTSLPEYGCIHTMIMKFIPLSR